jgi:hypothetical protein
MIDGSIPGDSPGKVGSDRFLHRDDRTMGADPRDLPPVRTRHLYGYA